MAGFAPALGSLLWRFSEPEQQQGGQSDQGDHPDGETGHLIEKILWWFAGGGASPSLPTPAP